MLIECFFNYGDVEPKIALPPPTYQTLYRLVALNFNLINIGLLCGFLTWG